MDIETIYVIEPPKGIIPINLKELWKYRELLFFLVWRDIKVRYKQTAFGVLWAVIQPLLAMVIFSIVFGKWIKLPTGGVPYPVFTYVALLPWQLFSFALSSVSLSLINEQNLVKKVYFPRIIIPVSSLVSALIDFLIAFVVLIALMAYYRIYPTTKIILLPLLLLLALMCALGIGLWLSALSIKYRDVRYVLPFLTQIWLYATPVVYSSSIVPDQFRFIYGINPMVIVVEGFRWVFLNSPFKLDIMTYASIGMVGFVLVSGLYYFYRTETFIADVL